MGLLKIPSDLPFYLKYAIGSLSSGDESYYLEHEERTSRVS